MSGPYPADPTERCCMKLDEIQAILKGQAKRVVHLAVYVCTTTLATGAYIAYLVLHR